MTRYTVIPGVSMRRVVAGPRVPPLIYRSVVFDFSHTSSSSSSAVTPQLWRPLRRRRLLLRHRRPAKLVANAQAASSCRRLVSWLVDAVAAAGLDALLVLLNPSEGRGGGEVGVAAQADAGLAAVRAGRAEATGAGRSLAQARLRGRALHDAAAAGRLDDTQPLQHALTAGVLLLL